MEVGVRELKAKLSEYLARAADGDDVTVTDRGRPIARIVAVHGRSDIERGFEEGWIEPPRRHSLPNATRFRATRSVLDVLDEDRG